ncbi:MAG TPA: hypothetical protein VNO81_00365, partial [Candidatus Nitrosotenuis sp.]|nr:hypothetical protein [Candidatus Nitrosotenuis sp.]
VWIAHPELGLTDLHPDLYLALVLQNLFRAATLPVSVQAAAAVDAYRQSVEGSGKRRLPVRELFLVGTLSVVLVWAWCSAVADLAGRLTGGQILMASASPLLTHDPSFKPGDDLLIQGDYYQTGGRIQAGQVALYVPPRPLGNLGGQFLATVRAGPGDRVLWRDGRLYVNGVLQNLPPAWQAALNSAGRGEQVLAGDQALLMVGLSLNPGITFEDAFIPARLLEGKAVAILNPRSHRRTLP